MDEVTGQDTVFHPAEIVVALEHADTVARHLETLGVPLVGRQDNADLGLAKVALPEAALGQAVWNVGVPGLYRPTHLDRLLSALREHFKAEYAGWVPTLGKNRLVGNVVGGGRVSHGGGSNPAQAEAPVNAQLRPDRLGLLTRVGVVDTAVQAQPALTGGWVGGTEDVLRDRSVHPAVAGHGTFVTGLVRHGAPGCVVAVRQALSAETGDADAWTVAT